VALFSDVDWVVIACVAAFLFFGPKGQTFVRQMGRWYARMLQFKSEIMSEVTASTGVPIGSGSPTGSLRSALLGSETPTERPPTPLPAPTLPGVITQVQAVNVWAVETQTLGAGMGPGTWWVSTSSAPGEVVRLR
jgi:hypothetical protein